MPFGVKDPVLPRRLIRRALAVAMLVSIGATFFESRVNAVDPNHSPTHSPTSLSPARLSPLPSSTVPTVSTVPTTSTVPTASTAGGRDVAPIVPLAFRPKILNQLEWGGTLAVVPDEGTQGLSVDVPGGVSLTHVSGRVAFPFTEVMTNLVVSVGGQRLGALYSRDAETDGSIRFDLALPTDVVDPTGSASVQFDASAVLPTTGCRNPIKALVVSDVVFATNGVPTPPKRLSEFFDRSVTNVLIESPDDATDAAAVQFAAVATLRSPLVRLDVTRHGSKTVSPGQVGRIPVVRRVVLIHDRTTESMRLVNNDIPTVEVRGGSASLMRAAQSLGSLYSGAASTDAVRSTGVRGRGFGERRVNLGELSSALTSAAGPLRSPSLEGSGLMSWRAAAPQSLFGGPIGRAHLKLSGRHTPVPKGGVAELAVLWNDSILTSIPFGTSDAFAVDVDVPLALLGRENNIELRVRYTNPAYVCARIDHPLRVDFDPASTLTTVEGQTLPAGFSRFPQTMKGAFRYAIDPTAMEGDHGIAAAAMIAGAMQRLSPELLVVEATTLEAVERGNTSAVVVGATPKTERRLGAPFQFGKSRVLTGSRTSVDFEISGPVGILQAYERNGIDVVVAGGSTPQLGSSVVAAMAAHPDGWYHLNAEMQLLDESHGTLIQIPRDRYVVQEPNELAFTSPDASSRPSWVVPVVGTLVAVLLLRMLIEGLRVVSLRRRAKKVVTNHDRLTEIGHGPELQGLERRRSADRRTNEVPPLRGDRRRGDRRANADPNADPADDPDEELVPGSDVVDAQP